MALGKKQIAVLEHLSKRASDVESAIKQKIGIDDNGLASLYSQEFVEYRLLGHIDTKHSIIVWGITDKGRNALSKIKAPESESRTIRIQLDIIREVQRLAEQEHRRFSNMVNVLLLEALEQRPQPAPPTERGVGEK